MPSIYAKLICCQLILTRCKLISICYTLNPVYKSDGNEYYRHIHAGADLDRWYWCGKICKETIYINREKFWQLKNCSQVVWARALYHSVTGSTPCNTIFNINNLKKKIKNSNSPRVEQRTCKPPSNITARLPKNLWYIDDLYYIYT
jgi:hypothetical protein